MKMKSFDIKNITIADDIETKEALALLNKHRLKYSWLTLVPIILFAICLIWDLHETNNVIYNYAHKKTMLENPELVNTLNVLCIILFITTIVCWIIYNKLIKPYKKLVIIAEHNDKIRHEEKIRKRERSRLESDSSKEYTEKDIDNTMNKIKN